MNCFEKSKLVLVKQQVSTTTIAIFSYNCPKVNVKSNCNGYVCSDTSSH